MTGILVWRFMLNLQEARRQTTGASGIQTTLVLGFDRFVGSIGGSLDLWNHELDTPRAGYVDA